MAEDIRKKIQIVIETVTEEAKSKIKDLDRAIDDLNRKTSSKAPTQRTTRTTDIKANKEEAESLKLLRAEMKAYVSAANVLNKRELTKSVKSGISSLPKSMKETADAISDYTKRVEASYKTIEEAMGTMTPKQKEVFEQMIPQAKLQALKDYTSVTGKLGKQIDLTDSSSKKFHMNLRKDVTAALIGFHVMRILGNNSKVLDATFTGLSKTLGALLDVVLMPMLNVLEPMLNAIMGLTEWIDSWGQAAKDALFFVIALAGAVLILHKALQSFTGRGLWGENAFKPIGGKTIGGFLKERITGKKAAGGPVLGQGAYIVGERGPEVFVPGQSGTIIPHDKIHREEGGDVYGPMLGGLGGAAAGASLAYAFTGNPLAAIAGGGLGSMFGYSLAGGDLSSVAETVGGGMSAIMENEGVQAVLATMSIVTSTIAAALAPIAPLLGAAGLLLGAVSVFGGRGGKGGGAGVDGRIAAEATIDVGQVTNKTIVKQGIGSQTAINMGARGTTKMLTAILLRMNGCFAICGMPVIGGKLDGAKGVLDKILPFIGGIGAAIAAWWASGFGKGSGEGTPNGIGVGMPEKERSEAGKGIAAAFVAFVEATTFKKAVQTIKVIYDGLTFVFNTAKQIIKATYEGIFYTIKTASQAILATYQGLKSLIPSGSQIISATYYGIKYAFSLANQIINAVYNGIKYVFGSATQVVAAVYTGIKNVISAASQVVSVLYEGIKQSFGIGNQIISVVYQGVQTIFSVASQIISVTYQGIQTVITNAIQWVDRKWNDYIVPAIGTVIEWVDRLWHPWAVPSLAGVYEYVTRTWNAWTSPALSVVTETVNRVWNAWIVPTLSLATEYVNRVWNQWIVPLLTTVDEWVNRKWNSWIVPTLTAIDEWVTRKWNTWIVPILNNVTEFVDRTWNLWTVPTLTNVTEYVDRVWNTWIVPILNGIDQWVTLKWNTWTDPILSTLNRYIDFINNPVLTPTEIATALKWGIDFVYSLPLVQAIINATGRLQWFIDLIWKLPTPEQLYGDIQKNVNSIAAGIDTEGQRIGNWLWAGIITAVAAFVGFEASMSSKINEGIALVKDNQTLALAISGAIGFIIASGLKLWESAQAALGSGSAIFGTIYRVIHDALVSLGINPNLEIGTSNVLVSLWGTGTTKAAPTIIEGLKSAIVSWWGSVFPPIISTVTGGVTSFLSGVFGGGSVAAQSDITTAWKNLITNSSTEATVVQRPSFTTLLKNMIVGGATDSTATSTPTFSSLLSNMITNATAQAKPAFDSIWTSVYSVDAAKRAAAAAANSAAIAAATAYGAAEAKEHGLIQTGVSATGVPLYRAPTLQEQVSGTLSTGQKYGYDKTGSAGSVPFVIQGTTIFTGAPAAGMIAAAQGKTGAYWDFSKGRLVYPGDPEYSCKAAGNLALPGCKDGVLSAGTASEGGTADQFKGRHGGVVSTTTGVGGNASTMRMMMKDGSYIDSTPGGSTLYYDASGKQVTASYQRGGWVKETGPAFLHSGEYVLPKNEVDKQVNNMNRGGDIIINNPIFQISGKTDQDLFDSFLRKLKSEGRRLGGTV